MEVQSDATGAIDSGAAPAAEVPSASIDTSSVSQGQPAGAASTEGVQGATPTTETDPMAGLPSMEELNAMPEGTQYKKSLVQMRTALDALNPKFTDLQTKFQPIEPFMPYLERFEKPEQLQEIVNFREKLNGWEQDPNTGQMVPATQSLVQELTASNPQRADYLAADLLNGETLDDVTGQKMPRIDIALRAMRQDPVRRAKAASILGLVEPASIAPTWQPSQEELDAIPRDLANITPEDKAMMDEYRKLPYDKREQLKVSDPEFVREYLADQRFKRETRERDSQREADTGRRAEQYQQYVRAESEKAGNERVASQFVERFQAFDKNVRETWQPIKAIDPQSPEAQGMDPAQIAVTNEKIQRTNDSAASVVTFVTAALSHPEFRFLAEPFAKVIGVTPEDLQKLDEARSAFASNNRNFGVLSTQHRFQSGNGNGAQLPGDVSSLETEANRSGRALIAHGNAVKAKIIGALSDFFSLSAQSHNQTLNGAAQARPAITGSAYDPTQVATRPPPRSEAEIRERNRADIARLAGV